MTTSTRNWLVPLLLAAGLGCHLYAARLLVGNPRAYPDHIAGFFFIAALTGVITLLLNRIFRKGRPFPWLFFGGLQFVFGLLVIFLQQGVFHFH